MTNRELFDYLVKSSLIRIKRGKLFDEQPLSALPDVDWDKVEGMMLGLAIGDSLGNTSEGWLPGKRREQFGEVRDYLPNGHAADAPGQGPRGYPSDDTQLAFWTLEQMLEDGRMDPARVSARFCRNRIFGVGRAVTEFLESAGAGKPWHLCGAASAGNGALMRIAPVLIPHIRKPTADLWIDTALCAMVTHNDTASISGCVAFIHLLWDLLGMRSPPRPDWWANEYVSVASELETGTAYRPRGGSFQGYSGPLWRFAQERLAEANGRHLSARDACDGWHSGAFLLETVPSVLYILGRHGHDPEEAIVRAANDTKDNDTIAAIVGAAVGALHGKRGLPARWISGLSGRTTASDDGKIFQILEKARSTWA